MSTATESSSSKSSTLIFGDAGEQSISPLEEIGDNAVDAKDECGETESRPDEYPQSDDDESVLPAVVVSPALKCELAAIVGTTEAGWQGFLYVEDGVGR